MSLPDSREYYRALFIVMVKRHGGRVELNGDEINDALSRGELEAHPFRDGFEFRAHFPVPEPKPAPHSKDRRP